MRPSTRPSTKSKKPPTLRMNSVALEYICLEYMGGFTLQERLAVLGPAGVVKTFADVLNNLDKVTAKTVLQSVVAEVTHEIELEVD